MHPTSRFDSLPQAACCVPAGHSEQQVRDGANTGRVHGLGSK